MPRIEAAPLASLPFAGLHRAQTAQRSGAGQVRAVGTVGGQRLSALQLQR